MRFWRLLVLAPMASLAACGGYDPITYPPLTIANPLTELHGNRHLNAVEAASFRGAEVSYGARMRGTYHKIPVGDFLIAQLVQTIPDTEKTKRIRLETFGSTCDSNRVFAPHAECKTTLIVRLETDKGERVVEAWGSYDVGPKMIAGDIAPPFTMGDPMVGIIQRQASVAVVGAVADWKKNAGY